VNRTIKAKSDGTFFPDLIPCGTIISSVESDGTHTLSFDDEKGLDAVAGKLGRERLSTCKRIVEDVINGKKWIVEIVDAESHLDRQQDIVDAMVNTVYARSKGRVPFVMCFYTPGVISVDHDENSEDELMKRIDSFRQIDLAVFRTPEWFTEMINYAESSKYSRGEVKSYRRFMRLLRSRLVDEEAQRHFITLKFRRWQFPGVRWLKRLLCKISNRISHADLEFCEGSKETCTDVW